MRIGLSLKSSKSGTEKWDHGRKTLLSCPHSQHPVVETCRSRAVCQVLISPWFPSHILGNKCPRLKCLLSLNFLVILQKYYSSFAEFILPLVDSFLCTRAKSLQSCLTLCDPMDSSPPGSSVHGILEPRMLEWVAISFSTSWLHSHVKYLTSKEINLWCFRWLSTLKSCRCQKRGTCKSEEQRHSPHSDTSQAFQESNLRNCCRESCTRICLRRLLPWALDLSRHLRWG